MAITYETTIGALSKEDKALAQLIMPREGFSSSVYSDVDKQGKETAITAGFGHKLTAEELKKYKLGDEINHKQAVDWLKADLARTHEASWKQAAQVPNATEELQDALHRVNYQLGTGWIQKFPTAWEHMKAGRWDKAIEEVRFTKEGSGKPSIWREQTPERVEDFVKALQTQHEASYEPVPKTPDYTEPMGIWAESKAEPKPEQPKKSYVAPTTDPRMMGLVEFDLLEHNVNPEEGREKLKKLVADNIESSKKTVEEIIEQRKVKIAGLMAMSDETFAFDFIGEAEAGGDEKLAGEPFSLPLPVWAFTQYLTDSAQAHFKSIFGGKPTDFHRTFEPTKKFKQEHYDALDKFILDHKPDWHKPSVKSRKPGWNSIDLTDDAYAALREKDSNLYDMAWTIGKVDFTVDPESKKITYSDNYGFKGSNFDADYPILGDSEGPTYEFTNPKK